MSPARIVLDASIAVAWCFEDEKTADSEWALDAIASGAGPLVPALWPYEVANALLAAERRKRVTGAQAAHFLSRLGNLGISIDDSHPSRTFEQVTSHAREWDLTVYDAAYLELAMREGLPLATLDAGLKSAAHRAGVRIAGPAHSK